MASRLRLTLCALVAAALATGAVAGPAQARLSHAFFGVQANDLFEKGPSYWPAQLDSQKAAGVGLIRQIFAWRQIEKSPGRYDFSRYDPFVGDVARHGMRLLPILIQPPNFRGPETPSEIDHPPTSNKDMADFAAALARRYGPSGTYWTEHPEVPLVPIRDWQIWNEPHLPTFWPTPSGPDPAAYTKLLATVGAAIKGVDPGADIVAAGISQSVLPGAIPLKTFIAGMYRAGAKRAFDTLAVHDYATKPQTAVRLAQGARTVMNRFGDRRKPLWITESGWATLGPGSPFTTTPKKQAQRLGLLLRTLLAQRRRLRLRGVVNYLWKDPSTPATKDFWGVRTGLLWPDGRPKPALRVYKRIVRAATGATKARR